jgi:hypothetical protein
MLVVAKAIYVALDAGLSVPVYDHAPQDQVMPFVEISQHTSDPVDTLATAYSEDFVTVTVWSDYRGSKQVRELLGEIYETLHDVMLTLDQGRAVICRVASRDARRDVDGVTYVGSATIRIVSQDC